MWKSSQYFKFLQLLELLNLNMGIIVPKSNVSLMGVEGAFLLGNPQSLNNSIADLIEENFF